jgi:hypothetical protein
VFAAFAQLGATRSAEQLEPFEIGAAMIQLGRVRTLAQRISKQNLLAQLKLTDVGRSAMVDTAREMDETLDILREGGIMMAVPKPPTRALREQIDEVDGAWGSIRAMALASPYDYARRSGVQRRADDPLLVRYFDDLATDLDRRAVAAVGLYKEVCIQNGVPSIVGTTAEEICTLMARATETSMLSERLAKQTSFVVGGVDQEEHLKGLQQTRERLDKTLLNALESSLIQAAMSPERGTEGNVVAGIGQSIQESWERLRVDVDRVLDGRQRELDLDQTLSTQEAFLWSVQRLSVAVERFAAQQRAKRRRASAVGAQ